MKIYHNKKIADVKATSQKDQVRCSFIVAIHLNYLAQYEENGVYKSLLDNQQALDLN